MIIAIFSDSHDNMDALEWALAEAATHGAQHGIHCGDIVAGFMAERMARAPFDIFAVFGNNDGDHARLQHFADASKGTLAFSGAMSGTIELDDQKIFVCHYPHTAEEAVRTNRYDAVFYGHTHAKETHTEGGTVVCNPGELYGGRTGVTSFALYDTTTRAVRFIERT